MGVQAWLLILTTELILLPLAYGLLHAQASLLWVSLLPSSRLAPQTVAAARNTQPH